MNVDFIPFTEIALKEADALLREAAPYEWTRDAGNVLRVLAGLVEAERARLRQNAPEFLVKVVDPCADKLGEFSLEERGWIELLAESARNQAKTRIRADKAASNAARSNTEAEKLLNLRFQADDEMVMALGAIPK